MNAPPEIAAAAQELAEVTREQRARTLELALQGSLEVEDDRVRLVAFIERSIGVDRLAAEAIAAGKDPGTMKLTAEQKDAARALQQVNSRLPIAFVEQARAAAHGVGRLITDSGKEAGSCFMISPDLLITNHHVLRSRSTAAKRRVEFNFELDEDAELRPVTRFRLDPDTFFVTDKRRKMDFTVVALKHPHVEGPSLHSLGFCPLSNRGDKHALGFSVNIVGHPGESSKQVIVRENRLVFRTDELLVYMGDTQQGSSGSLVCNDHWEAIALHHWAGTTAPLELPSGLTLPDRVNEGVRASAIFAELSARLPSLPLAQQLLLRTALTAGG